MTENRCCGFCVGWDNLRFGHCRLKDKKVKYGDCCDDFLPMDWEYKV